MACYNVAELSMALRAWGNDPTFPDLDECTASLITAFAEILFDEFADEPMRTWVKVERGHRRGRVGTIAGTIDDRKNLQKQTPVPLKVILLEQDKFYTVLVSDLRELSVNEQILLGVR